MLLGFIGGIGPVEMIIVGIIAVLLFGKRLPEVGRSLGRGITEFKRGIKEVQDEVEEVRTATTSPYVPPARSYLDDGDQPSAPKFDPPERVDEVEEPIAPKSEPSPAEAVTLDTTPEPAAKPAKRRSRKAAAEKPAEEEAAKQPARKRSRRKQVEEAEQGTA